MDKSQKQRVEQKNKKCKVLKGIYTMTTFVLNLNMLNGIMYCLWGYENIHASDMYQF